MSQASGSQQTSSTLGGLDSVYKSCSYGGVGKSVCSKVCPVECTTVTGRHERPAEYSSLQSSDVCVPDPSMLCGPGTRPAFDGQRFKRCIVDVDDTVCPRRLGIKPHDNGTHCALATPLESGLNDSSNSSSTRRS